MFVYIKYVLYICRVIKQQTAMRQYFITSDNNIAEVEKTNKCTIYKKDGAPVNVEIDDDLEVKDSPTGEELVNNITDEYLYPDDVLLIREICENNADLKKVLHYLYADTCDRCGHEIEEHLEARGPRYWACITCNNWGYY